MASDFNPYSPPKSAEINPVPKHTSYEEIILGSEPMPIRASIRRAFDLTKRNWAFVIVAFIILKITSGFGYVMSDWIDSGVSVLLSNHFTDLIALSTAAIGSLLELLLTTYLGLGFSRLTLDIVDGKKPELSSLFSQGNKVINTLGAFFLFVLIVGLGLVLLIVPGIYLASRLCHYQHAIVDKDLGPREALKYSWALTYKNTLPQFLIILMGIIIVLAGLLAFFFGVLFALPLSIILFSVSYRFLQYGENSLRLVEPERTF